MKLILKDKQGNIKMEEDLKDNVTSNVKHNKIWVGFYAFPIDFDIDFINGDYVVTGND